jgi:hypothetical protein
MLSTLALRSDEAAMEVRALLATRKSERVVVTKVLHAL